MWLAYGILEFNTSYTSEQLQESPPQQFLLHVDIVLRVHCALVLVKGIRDCGDVAQVDVIHLHLFPQLGILTDLPEIDKPDPRIAYRVLCLVKQIGTLQLLESTRGEKVLLHCLIVLWGSQKFPQLAILHVSLDHLLQVLVIVISKVTKH